MYSTISQFCQTLRFCRFLIQFNNKLIKNTEYYNNLKTRLNVYKTFSINIKTNNNIINTLKGLKVKNNAKGKPILW